MNEEAAPEFHVRPASPEDIPLVLAFVRELAEYERLSHLVSVTEARLRESLFGERPGAVALDDWTIVRVTGPALEKLANMR